MKATEIEEDHHYSSFASKQSGLPVMDMLDRELEKHSAITSPHDIKSQTSAKNSYIAMS